MTDVAELHDDLRPLMFSIAYRMLGSVAEAEDVVQEAFLRLHAHARSGEPIDSPDAYATTVTTRLAIDALRSARRRRESYVGSWLPEPLLDADADPAHRLDLDETVSVAFLLTMERLSPLERAVFLLREIFEYDYPAIADVVGRTETYCRQLLVRAKRHLRQAPRFDPSPVRHAELSHAFLAALRDGDTAGLERLLAEDVVFHGDGGGKAPAVTAPVTGAVAVARFLVGLARRGAPSQLRYETVLANGQPGILVRTGTGDVLGLLALHVVDGRVTALHNQINPDKLAHLGPVGDLNALLRDTARAT